eukprot:TRINITY_DN54815_c0_g1_i1.p1 TRINITY_DN54815_c0_g1~~TRINITY_DN54815_c0_g1_i1.p1  ORF type:complete len:101 (+),score=9.17 TRINITY_DN54815_c0_g1_i1:23-304(+)
MRLDTLHAGLAHGPWRRVVMFATGAYPVEMRAFDTPLPVRPELQECVWLMPSFSNISDDEQWPLWWELSPEVVYSSIRNEVIAHSARAANRRE